MALIIQGNLIVRNGGAVLSEGDQSWQHEKIYKEGADVIVDGVTLRVGGEIVIGGLLICEDTSYSAVVGE